MKENRGKIAILLNDFQNVLQHLGPDPETSVRRQAAQSHDVKLEKVCVKIFLHNTVNTDLSSNRRGVNSAAHAPNNNIIVKYQLGQFPSIQHILQ